MGRLQAAGIARRTPSSVAGPPSSSGPWAARRSRLRSRGALAGVGGAPRGAVCSGGGERPGRGPLQRSLKPRQPDPDVASDGSHVHCLSVGRWARCPAFSCGPVAPRTKHPRAPATEPGRQSLAGVGRSTTDTLAPRRRAVARSARPVPASCIGTAWARRPQPRRISHSGLRFRNRLGGVVRPDLDLQRRDRYSARGNLSVEEREPMPGSATARRQEAGARAALRELLLLPRCGSAAGQANGVHALSMFVLSGGRLPMRRATRVHPQPPWRAVPELRPGAPRWR